MLADARPRRCPFEGVDPVYLSLSRLRRRKFDGAIEVATELLSRNALDQQVRPQPHASMHAHTRTHARSRTLTHSRTHAPRVSAHRLGSLPPQARRAPGCLPSQFRAAPLRSRLTLPRPFLRLQVWWIKCRALTNKNWIDDGELPEEGLGEMLLDDNSTAQVARPGTSFTRPESSAAGGPSPAVRPTSTGGRPLSGFARPGSGLTRSSTGMSLERAMTSSRLGTAMTRPVTTSGRFVRLGTASLASEPGGPFVNLERINMQKYAARPAMAKALCDYIFHVAANPKKAVELCAAATQVAQYKDWVWKARLGKGYFQLGLYREAEQQLLSSLKEQEMTTTYLQVCMCVRVRACSMCGVGASACVCALSLCVGVRVLCMWTFRWGRLNLLASCFLVSSGFLLPIQSVPDYTVRAHTHTRTHTHTNARTIYSLPTSTSAWTSR